MLNKKENKEGRWEICTICNTPKFTFAKYFLYCWKCHNTKKNRVSKRTSYCKICNNSFEHISRKARYCSDSCSFKASNSAKNQRIKRYSSVENTLISVFTGCKSRSKKNGREFTITKEYVLTMLKEQNGRCAMTDIILEPTTGGRNPNTISIDRIDNSKGYIIGNIQLVTKMFNECKNAYKFEDVVKLCKGFIIKNKINV